MGKRFALLVPLFLAMCAAPPTWQKPGVDGATLAKDTADCQAAAEREAVRRYPHGFDYAPSGVGGMTTGLQRDETNRSIVEASSFKACMEGRGYARS
ncbi:MAG TPA: hypothetical protein VLL30_02830 [Reyranella sp.]|nr:hypothetical protein [Reyranella sp.]